MRVEFIGCHSMNEIEKLQITKDVLMILLHEKKENQYR